MVRFIIIFVVLWAVGCVSPHPRAFHFDDPTTVVAQAWRHIESGAAHEEGSFSRDKLRLSQVDYSHDGDSVEVSFYIIDSFKTDADGRFTCKLLDIEMDNHGEFISASTADRSQGGRPPTIGF